MSEWKPMSEITIWEMITLGWERMSHPQRRLWEIIRIDPVRWRHESYRQEGAEFWVVAIYGQTLVWYNDIEDGFNLSRWSMPGVINDYGCNQLDLEEIFEWVFENFTDESRDEQKVNQAFYELLDQRFMPPPR